MQVDGNVDNNRCCGINRSQFIAIMCVVLIVAAIILAVAIFLAFRESKPNYAAAEYHNTSGNLHESPGNKRKGFGYL